MTQTADIGARIQNALAGISERREKFREDETRKFEAWQQRLEKLSATFEQLREVWRPPLEKLVQAFGDKVSGKPILTPSTRDITLTFQSEVATIRLRFRATSDADIRKLILAYDLEIFPVLMKFEPHSQIEMPLDAIDRDAIAKWIDERILAFVDAYIAAHESKFYLRDQLVKDPVSGTEFPKFDAASSLSSEGRVYYFISDETRREFEKRHGGKGK